MIYNKEASPAVVYDKEESAKRAVVGFKAVFECGPKIELDHHLVYHAREFIAFLNRLFIFFGGVWGGGAFDVLIIG